MGEPDKEVEENEASRGREAYADTALGTGAEEASARRLPTPVLLEDEEDEGPDPLLGRVLGGLYKVEERIGEGGMGTVYAARHIHLNKRFAIKVLSRKIAQHRQAVERLRQEAVAASSIEHDNIVDVVSFDTTDDGDVFIVMELLKGVSLSDLLEKGPVPVENALHITYQLCGALHAAHERGIVHRDLKPENVFIVRKRQADFAKVLDFGISKVRTAETEEVRMTKTGQLVGTPLYMSPEQAKGEQDVDRRADVYALGVMLYEMLCGVPPFEGSNYFQLLWKHGNEDPVPPSRKNAEVSIPPELEDVVLRALAKDPDTRLQSMAELEAALQAATPDLVPPGAHFLSTPSLTPMSMPPARTGVAPQRSFGGMIAAGVIGVAAIMLVAVFLMTREDAPEDPITVDGPDEGTAVVEAPQEDEAASGALGAAEENLPVGADTPGEGTEDVDLVPVHFVSDPPGATVVVDGRELGTAPLVAPLPRSDEATEVTFSLARHRDDVVSVVPVEGARVEGTLRPVRRRGPGTGPALPFKTEF